MRTLMEIGKAWTGISAVRCKASGSPEKRAPSDVKGQVLQKACFDQYYKRF